MEFRRHSRKSATAPAVTPASQPGCPMDDDVDQTVDSRAYAFAYLVQEPLQLPADFPLDEDFDYALFLPQELVPRFETPRYVPRLLLEGADRLSVYAHPSCGSRNTTILFGEISHIKLDRFFRFFVPPQELIKSGLFRQQFSWTFGSEVVLTRRSCISSPMIRMDTASCMALGPHGRRFGTLLISDGTMCFDPSRFGAQRVFR